MAAQDIGRLPVRNDVDVKTLFKDKPHIQKGIALLADADDILQFYDRRHRAGDGPVSGWTAS